MQNRGEIFTEFARAKVNLTLHVEAVNADGFHPLQSLVVFADVGDELSLRISDAREHSLNIEGEFAVGLSCTENSILSAAHLYEGVLERHVQFLLTKNLPVASGIGGGTADAAAAVRLLNKIVGAELGVPTQSLGADFTVCYLSRTCIMEGIGHALTPLVNKGKIPAILVNPRVEVSTRAVFKCFDQTVSPHTSQPIEALPAEPLELRSLLEMTQEGRNDLQAAAISLAPVIQTVLDVISAQDSCKLARMSGSGATCFGLFETVEAAENAAITLKALHPNWWCVTTLLGDEI